MIAQVLCIGGADPSAGAGVQADLKTIQALGGYAATVISAISVQHENGSPDIFALPAEAVRLQIQAVLEDMKPVAVKTGFLANEDIVNAVGDFLDHFKKENVHVVVDPVMTDRTGKMLLDKPARDAIKRRLMPHADMLVVGLRETQDFTGMPVSDIDSMKHAAEMLKTLGARTVLIKGGTPESGRGRHLLADEEVAGIHEFSWGEDVIHGVDAALSSGIASGLAKGLSIKESYVAARSFVLAAARTAHTMESGYRTLNHAGMIPPA